MMAAARTQRALRLRSRQPPRARPRPRKFTITSTDRTIVDLSTLHRPISPTFLEQPTNAEEWAPYVLPPEALERFTKEGFVSGIKVLEEWQVDALNEELEGLYDKERPESDLWYAFDLDVPTEDPRDNLFHALGAWRISELFHDLLWAPALRMAAFQLLGGHPFRFMHDQLFTKPARDGGVVAWHQDFSYWVWTKPMAHLTMWIGLDDVQVDSGCLWYIPGSHRWGLLPMTGLAHNMEAVKRVLSSRQIQELEEEKIPVVLKKGYATIHHPLMMHGSYGNTSSNQRRATVVNVMRDGVLSNVSGKDMGNFPHPPHGAAMGGQFYPSLVSKPELVAMRAVAGSTCDKVNLAMAKEDINSLCERFDKDIEKVESMAAGANLAYDHQY